MQFSSNEIYHIFNRGNNSQRIFFNRENYLFFLKKIKTYISSYADILAWCLMPNHFHLMVYINRVETEVNEIEEMSEQVTGSRQLTGSHQLTKGEHSEQVTESRQLTRFTRKRTLNQSVSILLRSYTRAIQRQQNITGSLFQHRTKAVCLSDVSGVSPAWFQTNYGTLINIPDHEKEYPWAVFNYILQNPVMAGLVKKPEDWEFSSFRDVTGIRAGKLINMGRASELGFI